MQPDRAPRSAKVLVWVGLFLVVAGGLLIGTVLAFVGLMVVVPVLGHATWHLYRKLIA